MPKTKEGKSRHSPHINWMTPQKWNEQRYRYKE